jgi:hypothetical protein
MASSRNIVLAVLVVAIAIGVFYMMDPTMGGLLGGRADGFQNTGAVQNPVVPQQPAQSASGSQPTNFENGDLIKKAIENAKAIERAKEAFNTKEGFMNPPKKEKFQDAGASMPAPEMPMPEKKEPQPKKNDTVEGFASYQAESMPFAEAQQPANCYPKNQLTPNELLPADPNSKWAQVNPMGQGDISGKNFLSAGALIGVNTVGQSLRNANQQLRSEPPCPQMQVSIWNQSTIEPDLIRRPLEGF